MPQGGDLPRPQRAGKTTTCAADRVRGPDPGHRRIAGIDVQTDRIAAAEHLGYLPENGPLYDDMTPHAAELLARPGVWPARISATGSMMC
ncbi:MAG: hypothetical protein WKF75_20455 [Singulisphaera sp.]